MASADFSLRLDTVALSGMSEISPGKNALLHCTTAGSTPLPLDHESFAVRCPLALVGSAFYPVLVHRPAASLHASSPHSVTLMLLRFASLVVINSRWDLHPQECAHAGRTTQKAPENPAPLAVCNAKMSWSGRRDSNPRPQPWQGCALPLSYSRVRTWSRRFRREAGLLPQSGAQRKRLNPTNFTTTAFRTADRSGMSLPLASAHG